MTHTCTHCGKEVSYKNKVSWMNVRTKLTKDGFYHCRQCAGKIGRENSNIKPTGRPRGSKNRKDYTPWNKGWAGNVKNIGWHKKETRMLQIARRNGYETYEEYRDSLPEWKAYKIDVWRLTNQQPLHLLENYDKRGVNGQDGAYTLDHKVSIKRGFIENIPPDTIAHIDNLQMLPWEENITKGWKQ